MSGTRRQAREAALQLLFEIELTRDDPPEVVERAWRMRNLGDDIRPFCERLVLGAWAQRATIDDLVQACAEHWRLERMSAVDRNLLRLAAFELLFESDTPAAVVLDEAVDIARRFGSEDSPAFVNGVLDAVRRRIESGGARA